LLATSTTLPGSYHETVNLTAGVSQTINANNTNVSITLTTNVNVSNLTINIVESNTTPVNNSLSTGALSKFIEVTSSEPLEGKLTSIYFKVGD